MIRYEQQTLWSAARAPGRSLGRFSVVAVGVDFARSSDPAIHHAAAIARQLGASLVLIHICRTVGPEMDVDAGLRVEMHRREQVAAAERELEALRDRCKDEHPDLVTRGFFLEGNPQTDLAEAADEAGAGLLVVGSNGRRGLRRALMGSVAERSVREAEVDVLVVHDYEPSPPYRRALVGFDFSRPAMRAVEMALHVVPEGGEVQLLFALDTSMFGRLGLGAEADELAEEYEEHGVDALEERAEPLLDHWRNRGRKLRFVCMEGTAAQILQEVSEVDQPDLVALGSHGHGSIRRWLLGSVTETLIRHACCPVLVARAA